MESKFTDLGKIAYAFMIVATVITAFVIIPMAWCIPMTIHYKKTNGRVGVGFKVCSLLFCGLVAGILMLCDTKSTK